MKLQMDKIALSGQIAELKVGLESWENWHWFEKKTSDGYETHESERHAIDVVLDALSAGKWRPIKAGEPYPAQELESPYASEGSESQPNNLYRKALEIQGCKAPEIDNPLLQTSTRRVWMSSKRPQRLEVISRSSDVKTDERPQRLEVKPRSSRVKPDERPQRLEVKPRMREPIVRESPPVKV